MKVWKLNLWTVSDEDMIDWLMIFGASQITDATGIFVSGFPSKYLIEIWLELWGNFINVAYESESSANIRNVLRMTTKNNGISVDKKKKNIDTNK